MDIESQDNKYYEAVEINKKSQKIKRRSERIKTKAVTKKVKTSTSKSMQEEKKHEKIQNENQEQQQEEEEYELEEEQPTNKRKTRTKKEKKIQKKEKEVTKNNNRATRSSSASASRSSPSASSSISRSVSLNKKSTTKSPKKKAKSPAKKPVKSGATSYKQSRVQKAKTQRMFLMRVERISDDNWSFTVLGFSGKNYIITIDRQRMKCGCIDFRIRQQTCKHLYFIASQIAQQDDLVNQMSNNPRLNNNTYDQLDAALIQRLRGRLDEKQKPAVQIDMEKVDFAEDPDCAICFENLTENDNTKCKTCKKFFHKSCIDLWLNKHQNCPLCRGLWVVEEKSNLNGNDTLGDGAFARLKIQNVQFHQQNQILEEDDEFD